ncbi:MAG TPA: class I SAM-dependent methyltransferase [Pyrinomonadaceae bacterium]|jgi:SAM-dependent methyltransferase|nr:class I SAM-dependent methyltransferase [Pyrinomonadaceae bacterium]
MDDSITRFSNRAENYARYRPNYPAGVINLLESECGLVKTSLIADVGSGTGILSELFLRNGNVVFGIEPNAAMRKRAEELLRTWPKFVSIDATAEATTLDAKSVDFITAAQAFHWFDRPLAKKEFTRILKPVGWVVLIWNERRLDSTVFLQEYETLLLRFGTDYAKVRHENVTGEVAEFFLPAGFELRVLENVQHFDLESLKGRVLSSSYMPDQSHPNFKSMVTELERLFYAQQKDGIVTFEYETRIYYGHLQR